MASEIEVNGTKIGWTQLTGILALTFWLGGLSITVAGNSSEISEHKKKGSHDTAAQEITRAESERQSNAANIEKIEQKLRDIENKLDANQKEILKALRESD